MFRRTLTKHSRITNQLNSQVDYDITIVGSGMVGSALACSLARNPTTNHLKVAVIEGNPPKDTSGIQSDVEKYGQFTNRVVALNHASERLFQDMGITFDDLHGKRYNYMQVWDALGDGSIEFDANSVDKTHIGAIVRNDVIQSTLWDLMGKLENVDVICPVKVEGVELVNDAGADQGFATVSLQGGDQLKTRLIVGADGAMSKIRSWADIPTVEIAYNQHAVCTVIKALKSESALDAEGEQQTEVVQDKVVARQRFTPDGAVALLPMNRLYDSDEERQLDEGFEFFNVVWSTTQSHATFLKSLDDDEFFAALDLVLNAPPVDFYPNSGVVDVSRQASMVPPSVENLANQVADSVASVASRIMPSLKLGDNWKQEMLPQLPFASYGLHGSVSEINSQVSVPLISEVCTPRQSFPLKLMHAKDYVRNRLALVGDAGHVIHPLAGQGVNLGFGDVQSLVDLISQATTTGGDIGHPYVLKDFESDRMTQNLIMTAGVHGIQRLFSTSLFPFAMGRNVGLKIVDNLPFVKNEALKRALGN